MTQQSEGRTLSTIDDLDLIVDADSHMGETVEKLLPYVDDEYSWAREMMSRTSAPRREVFSSSQQTPQFTHRSDDRLAQYMAEGDEYTLDTKLEEMNELGIDFSIVDPGINLDHHTITNTQFSVALMSAYNAWLVDQLDGYQSFKGTLLVSGMAPEESAAQIDRWAGEDSIAGVSMPAVGITPPPGDAKYDPIYEVTEANDLPLVFHGGSGSTLYGWPTVGQWAETFSEAHVVVHPMTAMWNLTTIMLRGVPERYPDLDIVFQEAGIGWVPYLTWRLDDHYLENTEEMPLLERMPSEYIADQFYFTTQPIGHTERNPQDIARTIEMIGPDSVMYSADLPHPDHDPPQALFDRIRNYFDVQTVENIMGNTAVSVYGL